MYQPRDGQVNKVSHHIRASRPWPRDTQGLTDWCILNACAPTTMGVSGYLAKVAEVLSFRDHPWSCTSIHRIIYIPVYLHYLSHWITASLYMLYLASWLWFIFSCMTAFDVGASHLAHHWLKWPPDHHTSLRSRTSPLNSGRFSSPWMTFIVLSSYFKALHHL